MLFYILAAVGLYLLARRLVPRWTAFKRSSPAERSFMFRFGIFSWVLAFVFVVAVLFLPNKGRVLMLVPIFIVGMSLAQWWQSSRERLRREAKEASDFARARRVN